MFKLELYGTSGSLLKWIEVFLSICLQMCCHRLLCFTCLWHYVYSVPQGSVLGPIFFLIYVTVLSSAASKRFIPRNFNTERLRCASGFYCYVHCHVLVYCSIEWNSGFILLTDLLRGVRRRFTKRLLSIIIHSDMSGEVSLIRSRATRTEKAQSWRSSWF